MNIDQLRQELAADEGCRYEIYLDHLGLETFGIGHLVTKDDPEYGLPVGTPVSEERVQQVFRRDIAITLEDCSRLYSDFAALPEEAQLVIANMMFNLGYPRLSNFVNMKTRVDTRDWNGAAEEMIDSKWFDQVPNRAKRLVARMRSLEDG